MNSPSNTLQTRLTHESTQPLRSIRKSVVVCSAVVFVMLIGREVRAQQANTRSWTPVSDHSAPSSASSLSKNEQLAQAIQALRSAESQSASPGAAGDSAGTQVSVTPLAATPPNDIEPKELFLDLRSTSDLAKSGTQSPQAAATSLNVSMTSSPAQVLMRAVAWIAIILCVSCLVILGARHWQRQRGLLPTTSARSRVLETLSLGPSRTVSLIEMQGYRALVASDATGIRSLVLAPSPFEETLEHESVENTDA